MLACNVLMPGGINGDCQIPLSEVKNLLITDKDVKFSYTNKDVLSNWTNLIKQSLTIYAVAGVDSYNNTTDDPNIVTGAVSKTKKITNVPLPSFEFFLETNMCDFKEVLNTVQGGNYGIFYELQDGTILGSIDTSGTEVGYFKPFKCRVNASSKLIQEVDATTAFKLYVMHTNKQQLFDQFFFAPTWDTTELVDAMPIGLNVVKTGVMSGATAIQPLQVNVRCGAGKTGLVVGDIECSTTMSNVVTPHAAVLTETGGGGYTVTLQKSTSTPIVTGDYIYLRFKVLVSSDVTYLSNWIRCEGVTP
jgi:hypothetical protein